MTMVDFLVVSEKHSDALNLLTLACRMGLCKKGKVSHLKPLYVDETKIRFITAAFLRACFGGKMPGGREARRGLRLRLGLGEGPSGLRAARHRGQRQYAHRRAVIARSNRGNDEKHIAGHVDGDLPSPPDPPRPALCRLERDLGRSRHHGNGFGRISPRVRSIRVSDGS